MLKSLRRLMPRSIRQRLSLSYVAIALIAAMALGGVLLTTLREYYAQREMQYLEGNARAVSGIIAKLVANHLSPAEIKLQVQNLSFLTQSRVRVMDAHLQLLSDSGSPMSERALFLDGESGGMKADVVYGYQSGDTVPVSGFTVNERIQKTASSYSIKIPATPSEAPIKPLPPIHDTFSQPAKVPGEPDNVFVMVSGTPYGFSFDRELSFGSRSQQRVMMPVAADGRINGFVELSEGPAYGTEIVDSVARGLLSASLIAFGLAVITGWFISRQITPPLQQLVTVTNRMADGKLSTRVNLLREDEFGVLGRSFNEMASRVETTVTTLRRFVADAAHELHTPITALHANLELALTENDDQQRFEFIRRSQEQLKRLETLTNNLLDLSRLESATNKDERTVSDVAALAQEVVELYASRAEHLNIQFQCDISECEMMARVNEPQIRRVLSNLLDNALKFTPENGLVSVHMERLSNSIVLWVRDTGIGIPPEDVPDLFNRFRRGRNAMTYPGSGLGLAITRVIVENHGGKIHLESPGKGTTIRVQLPAFTPQEAAA